MANFKTRSHIAIDARMLTGPTMHGIARYVFHLLRALVALGSSQRFFVLCAESSPLRDLSWPDNFTLIPGSAPWISLQEQWQLPRLFTRYGIDLFHSPSFVAPVFASLPQLLTIHDLNHLALPQFYSPFHRYYYELAVKRVARRSPLVITVSQFSRQEIATWLKVSPERVVVTYGGVSESFYPVSDSSLRNLVKAAYQLPERFVFCLGSERPHKNNLALVKAYAESSLTIPLVISTPATAPMLDSLNAHHKSAQVKFLPYIDDAHLPAIYSMAELFIFPTLYEGFGLPALEAMACGCPVLVSEVCSLPEIVGDLGYYFNPRDIHQMTQTLAQTLRSLEREDAQRRKQRVLHARSFSWERMAGETLAIYERLLR